MDFAEFQQINKRRCESKNGFNHPVNTTNHVWPWHRWALCVAGESGELCNRVKKVLRGDFTLAEQRTEILKELADIITYADLMISSLDGDTNTVVLDKFNEVSMRVNWLKEGELI